MLGQIKRIDKEELINFILLVIIGFALLIRVKYFGLHRLTLDEALYAGWANRIYDKLDLLLNGVSGIDKPPLLLYLQALSYFLFGLSENAARFPNLIAGLGNVIVIYHICKKYFNNSTGLVAAFLVAVCPYFIAFDISAYTDTLSCFFGLLSIYFISKKDFVKSGVFIGLAFGTKQFGILYLPLAILTLYIDNYKNEVNKFKILTLPLKQFLKGFGITLIILLFVSLFSNPPLGFLIKALGNQSQLLETINESFISRFTQWFNYIRGVFWIHWSNVLLFVAIAINGIYYAYRLVKNDIREKFLLYFVFLLFSLTYFAMLSFIRFQIYPRYILAALPFIIILISEALVNLFNSIYHILPVGKYRKWIMGILVAPLIVFGMLNVQDLDSRKFKLGAFSDMHDGIESAAWFIKNKMDKRPLLFTCELSTSWALKFYCYGHQFEKTMWITKRGQIEELTNKFPDSPKYILWDNRNSLTYQTMLDELALETKMVFEVHTGLENKAKYSILKIIDRKLGDGVRKSGN